MNPTQWFITAALFALTPQLTSAATVVAEGSSVSYSFNSMTLVSLNASPLDQAGFYFITSGDNLTPGDSPKVQLFENAVSSTAFANFSYLYSNRDQPSTLFGGTQLKDNVWNDFQGALTITMLKGSVSIDTIVAWAIINGDRYETANLLSAVVTPPTVNPNPSGSGGENEHPNAVPLPSSLPLMASALVSVFALRRKRSS